MNRKVNIWLAIAAGLIGGALSHYLAPLPVLAQTQAQKEIRSQSFVLVDSKNNVVGAFKASENGSKSTVVLIDSTGKEIWRAGVAVRALAAK
jgi:hypothetical protein